MLDLHSMLQDFLTSTANGSAKSCSAVGEVASGWSKDGSTRSACSNRNICSACSWVTDKELRFKFAGKRNDDKKSVAITAFEAVMKHISLKEKKVDRMILLQFETLVRMRGNSGGVAAAIAIEAAILGIRVPTSIAVTGAINEESEVLPVGEIVVKVLGCIENGMKSVIVPFSNYSEIPELLKLRVEVHPVKDLSEAMKIIRDCAQKTAATANNKT